MKQEALDCFPYREDLWEYLPQKRPNLGKFNQFKIFFYSDKKHKDAQNRGSLHTTSVLKKFCKVSFHLSPVTTEISVLRSNAQKPNKSIYQYVTMATAEPFSIFLCMVWVNMFAYDRNWPQAKLMMDQVLFFIMAPERSAVLLTLSNLPKFPDQTGRTRRHRKVFRA